MQFLLTYCSLNKPLDTKCTSIGLVHYKNKRVALTQLGLSQLQVHYPTMCIQALSWVKACFLQCVYAGTNKAWPVT